MYGRRKTTRIAFSGSHTGIPPSPRRAEFLFPSAARRMTSGLRYLSRRLHREQGTGTWARETKDPTPSSALPPPRQRKPSAPRHPAARQEPWPSSIPARVKRATTATRCTGQKPPFSPRPSVPFRGTDGRSGRDGDAGLRECGGGARKTQAKPNQGRRPDAHRGVTSVLPSPWTWTRVEPRASTSPRGLPLAPWSRLACVVCLPTPSLPWQWQWQWQPPSGASVMGWGAQARIQHWFL